MNGPKSVKIDGATEKFMPRMAIMGLLTNPNWRMWRRGIWVRVESGHIVEALGFAGQGWWLADA